MSDTSSLDEAVRDAKEAIQKARAVAEREFGKAKGGKGGKGIFNRWPAGSGGGKGGQFAPKKGGSGSGGGSNAYAAKTPKSPMAFFGGMLFGGGKGGEGKPDPSAADKKPGAPGLFGGNGPLGNKPSNAKPHPKVDDNGNPVTIKHPTKPSDKRSWDNPNRTATFTPGGDVPDALNGVAFKSWQGPTSKRDWANVPGQNKSLDEPPLNPGRKNVGAGVIIMEDDGRVWLTRPTNAFGGYQNTFPKGTAEKGLSLQANAIKEAWEETGLKVEITGHLGDFERDTSVGRYYMARRVGGTPKDMGWESQAVRLSPVKALKDHLNRKVDQGIADEIAMLVDLSKAKGGAKGGKGGAWQSQPRWPSGTPLGGQWMATDGKGLTMPPKIAGGLEGKNAAYQKKADAMYALAQGGAGNLPQMQTAVQGMVDKVKANDEAGKKSSHVKWHAQVTQYAAKVTLDVKAGVTAPATATGISGPESIGSWVKVAPKPGGSAQGAIFKDANGQEWLVKAYSTKDQATKEVIASKLLQAAGVNAVDMKLVDLGDQFGGGVGVASKMIDEPIANLSGANNIKVARKDFAAQAWINNWDAIGLAKDNTVVGQNTGKVYHVDPGGAFDVKAMGGKKPFGSEATAWDSMRDPSLSPNGAAVYGKMTKGELQASAAAVAKIKDSEIDSIVNGIGKAGGMSSAERMALSKTLKHRRLDIMDKAGIDNDGSSLGGVKVPKMDPVKAPPTGKAPAKPTFNSGMPKADGIYGNLASALEKAHKEGDLKKVNEIMTEPLVNGYFTSKTANGVALSAYGNQIKADLEKSTTAAAAKEGAETTGADGSKWTVKGNTRVPKAHKPASPAPNLPDFEAAKLPMSNTNAASHNKKVDDIAAFAKAGKADAILAMQFGSNTYAKKQVNTANAALAAMGSPHQVGLKQKANSHPAIADPGKVTSPSPAPKPKSKAGKDWMKLRPGEEVIAEGEEFGVKWATVKKPPKGFDASHLPDPPDFFAFGKQGPTGKWVSSVEAVNAANNKDAQSINNKAIATKSAEAVLNMKYNVLSKSTGQLTGERKPITDHPAAGVKEHLTNVVAELKAMTRSTYTQKHSGSFSGAYSAAAQNMAKKVGKKDYKEFAAHPHKAADYLVLNTSAASALPVPKQGQFSEVKKGGSKPLDKVLDQYGADSAKAYEKMSATEQNAAKSYTSDAYYEWNFALRKGDTEAPKFKQAQKMVNGMAKAATELPEGIILYRGIDVGESTYKSIVGGVIQDGSFQSTSYGSQPAFASKQTWLRMHVGKGVKAVDATVFSDFKSGEREIILKNNARYAVLKVEKHDNFKTSTGASMGPKTIVDVLVLPHED